MRRNPWYGLVFAALLFGQVLGLSAGDALRALRDFTGARTRVVWCQQVKGAGSDVGAVGNELVLMGYDSDDGLGERAISAVMTNYYKPLLAPDGSRVVFSRVASRVVFVINWDGTGLREVGKGLAEDVWRDEKTGADWVYVIRDRVAEEDKFTGRPLVRYRLDEPGVSEVVWDETAVSADGFQVSRDGTRASGLFPWPNAGVAILSKASWERFTKGCWTSLAPDNSYRAWAFDGQHRNVKIFSPADGSEWTVRINGAPGIDGYEVYHPRWSSHPRYLAMTGPYKTGKKGKHLIRAGGDAVEVYLGRFSEDFTRVEDWHKLTENDKPDFFPDLWIEGGGAVSAALPARAAAPAARAKAPAARVKIEGRLVEITPTPSAASIAPYTRALVVYGYEVSKVIEGECASPKILVAHWAIRDKKPLDLGKETGGTYRLELELFDGHPELEGERLITETDEFDLPFYYEIGN